MTSKRISNISKITMDINSLSLVDLLIYRDKNRDSANIYLRYMCSTF